ncbi:hypoxanthine phosphoribosyltransferase [Christensenellaceae bacterium OttesenSCG-928-K19]|nr:hypoxanthine phosphoribosyltransferase [Christensenellaceae bacterium OttesenSCG-928-K19]
MARHYVEQDIDSILLSGEQIEKRVKELAAQISIDYEGKDFVAICILRGCVMFFADLMRHVTIPMAIEFMSISSYGSGSESSGSVKIKYDLEEDIRGKDVLIVEDIIDTGITLSNLTELLSARHPASLEVCCLLNKQDRRKVEVPIKYTGFDIPDEFVVGYGLDYDSKYRNYCGIGVLKREIYSD